MKIHKVKMVYRCSFCFKKFPTVFNLYNHICLNRKIRRGMSLYTVDGYIKKYGGIDKDLKKRVKEYEKEAKRKMD